MFTIISYFSLLFTALISASILFVSLTKLRLI